MSDSDMASKLIAVVVEHRNQIVELESQISRIDKANTGVEEIRSADSCLVGWRLSQGNMARRYQHALTTLNLSDTLGLSFDLMHWLGHPPSRVLRRLS